MYSASTSPGGGSGQGGGGGGEVTLRLREPEDIPEEVLARLEDTATLSISLQSDAVLRLGAAGTGEFTSFSALLTDQTWNERSRTSALAMISRLIRGSLRSISSNSGGITGRGSWIRM
jgi:hypothetical protein